MVAFGSRNLFDIPRNVLKECYIPMFGSNFRKILLGMFNFLGMILSQYSPKTFPWGKVGILHSHDMVMFWQYKMIILPTFSLMYFYLNLISPTTIHYYWSLSTTNYHCWLLSTTTTNHYSPLAIIIGRCLPLVIIVDCCPPPLTIVYH